MSNPPKPYSSKNFVLPIFKLGQSNQVRYHDVLRSDVEMQEVHVEKGTKVKKTKEPKVKKEKKVKEPKAKKTKESDNDEIHINPNFGELFFGNF